MFGENLNIFRPDRPGVVSKDIKRQHNPPVFAECFQAVQTPDGRRGDFLLEDLHKAPPGPADGGLPTFRRFDFNRYEKNFRPDGATDEPDGLTVYVPPEGIHTSWPGSFCAVHDIASFHRGECDCLRGHPAGAGLMCWGKCRSGYCSAGGSG